MPAVLARHPQVVLVDELAHTNTPGSKNHKRWQDVEELLDAGITVISTVNIQHLESLNDVVAQITGIEQKETLPDSVVRQAAQVELIDITPEALRRRLSHGNVYASDKIDAALSNYFRRGNLTALRELALLWLADQVDTALAKYRAENQITDLWEARERVVVAVTGGPESETLVRRASRIASKSSAELMVVHVIRGDGLAGLSEARMSKIRELAGSLDASLHTVVGDDVADALLDFAREINATQLVIGTSRRTRWARLFEEGIGQAIVERSGKIDVHLVTHEESRRGLRTTPIAPRERRVASWLAAVIVPSLICAITVAVLDRYLDTSGESALFFVGVLVVALLGGVAPAVLSAVLSSLLLNYYLTDPRHTFTIAEPSAAVTEAVLLLVAVAVAVLVDGAAKRAREARRASQEAELLTLFAGSVLRGADLETLLERVRETYSQRAVSMLREYADEDRTRSEVVASVGKEPCATVDSADTAIEVGDDEFWMLMAGKKLSARDRRVLNAVARQAAGLVRQREMAEEASRTEAIVRADELRRSLLSAVSHDLRTRWPRPRSRCPACAPRTSPSPRRTPPNCWPPSKNPSTRSPRWSETCSIRRGLPPACYARICSGCTWRKRCSARWSASARAPPASTDRPSTASRSTSEAPWSWPMPVCWNGSWPTSSTTRCAMRRTASCGSMPAGWAIAC
ncbi:hypothetical protein NIIDMKKI_12410 [Mycobacterium kansasii]|uniref:VWFA domain-containing protein n=1 Tax=Mycobacterium kansasii TaxID=1768 RepID=A0A7G1I8B7_MYCKA|nr:hypothetical protein NIIDMKKI_12410 [Mycobacterium kansasii]